MTALPPPTNGQKKPRPSLFPPSQADLKKRAMKAPTRNYQTTNSAWWGYSSAALDGRPVFTWFDIPRMMTDPQVVFISQLWRAPFQKVQFTVKASSPKVATFVQNTIKRFWRQSLPRLLARYFEFGFCAGGAEYEAFRGSVRLSKVKVVECRDVQPRLWKEGSHRGQFAGFMLTSGGPDSLTWVGVPHAFWFAGHARFGALYDRPPLAGMFAPWLEKNGRGGAVHMRRLWFRKNAARGMEVRYPPGKTNIGSEESQNVRDNQDLAREIADYHESNSTLLLENTKLPDGSGEYEWDVKYAEGHGDVAGFREYPKDLDEEMVKGAGIPLEVIQGSDSGSGYKGRLVSYGGFLGTVDELTGLILEDVDPWMRPLVHINYGPDAWYEIEPVSLAQIASEEEKRQPTNPVGQPLASLPGGGGGGGSGGAGQFQSEGVKTAAKLPFDLSTTETSPNGEILTAIKGLAVAVLAAVKARPALELSAVEVVPVVPAAPPAKLGCALIDMPPAIADQVRALAAKIPLDALAEKGCEESPHITARYGLHAVGPEDLRPVLADAPPVRIRLGGVSVFPAAECGKPYDVLKIDVESAGLRRLNRELACLPHTETHPRYCPHVTIAYVKPGTGTALAALAPAFNAEFVAKEVTYSDGSGGRYVLPLCGESHEMAATATSDDVSPQVKEQVFNQTQQKLMRTRKSTIAQLLALAMLRKQQEATASGKPEAAAGSLKALASLAGDPIQVARIVGMKGVGGTEMSAADWEVLELAQRSDPKDWVEVEPDPNSTRTRKHKKWRSLKNGAIRYQDHKPGTQSNGVASVEKAQNDAKGIVNKIVGKKIELDELPALAENLKHMKLADINRSIEAIRGMNGTAFQLNARGERKREHRVDRLLEWATKEAHAAAGKDAPPSAVPAESREPRKAKAKPATAEKIPESAPSPAKEPAVEEVAPAPDIPPEPAKTEPAPVSAKANPEKVARAKKAVADGGVPANLKEYTKARTALLKLPDGEEKNVKLEALRNAFQKSVGVEADEKRKIDPDAAVRALIGKPAAKAVPDDEADPDESPAEESALSVRARKAQEAYAAKLAVKTPANPRLHADQLKRLKAESGRLSGEAKAERAKSAPPLLSKDDLALAESRRGKKAAPVKSVIAAEVKKPVEEKESEPVAKAVPVDRLATDPGADRRALAAIAASHPEGSAERSHLEAAAQNIHDDDDDVTPVKRRRNTVDHLDIIYRNAVESGNAAAATAVSAALKPFGAAMFGAAPGKQTDFDERYYVSEQPVFTGDKVTVVSHPVVLNEAGGKDYVASKGTVVPAAAPAPAEVKKPVEKKTERVGAKPITPDGHTVAAIHEGGAVVAKDPKTGDLTTRFAAGEPAKQAERLGPAIASAMGEARMFPEAEDGLVPLGMLVAFVARESPGASRSDILAALSHMRATRQIQGQPLNEVQKLSAGGVSSLDESDPAKATLWDNGRAIHYWMMPAKKG